MSRSKTLTNKSSAALSLIKAESFGLFYLAVGIFFYISVFSYDPMDPSLFTYVTRDDVSNLGGLIGSYVADFFFFFFGAASLVIGLYFILNAFLLIIRRRRELKFLDFFIFLISAGFVSVFLHLTWGTIQIGGQTVAIGGTLGRVVGDVGQTYLGRVGIRLFALVGSLLTMVLATRLSLVTTISTSTQVLGRGVGNVGNRLIVALMRLKKWLLKRNEAQPAKNFTSDGFDFDNEIDDSPDEETFDESRDEVERILPTRKLIEPRIKERRETRSSKNSNQLTLDIVSGDYQLPPLAFLDYDETTVTSVDEESLRMNARILEKKLKDFAIDGFVTEIHPGPVITMYEFQPAAGVKLSRIVSLTDDLSLAMNGRAVRIVAPLPNKSAVGIEIPNNEREIVWFKDIIADERFQKPESRMVMALGKDAEGVPYVADLQKMPHLLVAGATGSGKSVSINTMITSILYRARPDEVRMIMIDPKMIELSIYQDIPHLLLPVVTDPKKANMALRWAVREMERRYRLLSDVHARNIENYNRKAEAGEIKNREPDLASQEEPIVHQGKLPYIVVIIDEFADLMMVSSKEVEESVCRLAQKARAAGIHVILATQRPSVDVITGIIKANFPARIAFKVTSRHDARTIQDQNGAESLLGQGDMLFMAPGGSGTIRLHGALITEKEILRIVDFLKKQAQPHYNESILDPLPGEGDADGGVSSEDLDEFYDKAVRFVAEAKRVSVSSIQRQFRIGYNRAARIVEAMEQQGVVSPPNHQGQREVLLEER